MGKGEVRTKGEEKGLAVFETRGYTPPRNRSQPASGWIDFAEDIFRQAAACRPRPGSGTELIYDGNNIQSRGMPLKARTTFPTWDRRASVATPPYRSAHVARSAPVDTEPKPTSPLK